MITVRITEYDWGTLRIIRRDNSYACIIHPEHAAEIAKLACGCYTSFKDEQGIIWMVDRDVDHLFFRAGYRTLTIKREEL